VIVVLCLVYSLACVEAGTASSSAEMHVLVLLAAFAASFVFLVSSATAVAPTVAAIVVQHCLLVRVRATQGQGLTLVHFSAQLEPILTRSTP